MTLSTKLGIDPETEEGQFILGLVKELNKMRAKNRIGYVSPYFLNPFKKRILACSTKPWDELSAVLFEEKQNG